MSRRKQINPKFWKESMDASRTDTEQCEDDNLSKENSENGPETMVKEEVTSVSPEAADVRFYPATTSDGFGIQHVNVESQCNNGDKNGSRDSPTVYVCPNCGKIFESPKTVETHLTSCIVQCKQEPSKSDTPPVGQQQIKCGLCGISVRDIGTLQLHTLQTHSVQDMCKPLRRDDCGSDEKVYTCGSCEQGFDSILSLHNHRNHCLINKDQDSSQNGVNSGRSSACTPVSCDQCDKQFRDPKMLLSHVEEEHNKPVVPCPACEQTFSDHVLLECHALKEHYLQKQYHYICSACGKSFFIPDELQRHLLDVHALQLYKCALCKQLFESRVDIQVHFAVTHSQQAESYLCRACGELTTFETEEGLRIHVSMFHLKHDHANDAGNAGYLKMPDLTRWPESLGTSRPASSSTPRAFPCKLCHLSFDVEFLYERHMESIHGTHVIAPLASLAPHYSSTAAWLGLVPPSTTSSGIGKKLELTTEELLLNSGAIPFPSAGQQPGENTISKCSICDRTFDTPYELAEHRLQHCRVTQTDKCAICQKPMTSLEDFYIHTHEHNGQGSVQACIICKQSLSSHIELNCHGKFHLRRVMRICHSCEKESPVLNESGICPGCQSEAGRSKSRDGQSNPKTPDLTTCPECSRCFETIDQLKEHCRTTHLMPYQCIKCQACFATEPEIRAHVTSHVLQEGVNHHCHLCLEVFDSPSKLQCHLIEHSFSGHSEFQCYLCGSMFTLSQTLQQHMLKHGFDERPYDCQSQGCNQKFFFRTELENHCLASHQQADLSDSGGDGTSRIKSSSTSSTSKGSSSTKTFKCGNCDKKFSTLELVAVHRRFCSGPKRSPSVSRNSPENGNGMLNNWLKESSLTYPCMNCPKVFTSLSALQGHSHVHMPNVRGTYPCSQCNKTFSTPAKMRNHQRQHNGEKLHHCDICSRSFSRRDNLKVHMKTHSKELEGMDSSEVMFPQGLPTLVTLPSSVSPNFSSYTALNGFLNSKSNSSPEDLTIPSSPAVLST